jgi:hypothetical protein
MLIFLIFFLQRGLRSGIPVGLRTPTKEPVFLVDFSTHEGERFLTVISSLHPELNRIERVSDDRFARFIQRVLDIDIPLSEIEEVMAA